MRLGHDGNSMHQRAQRRGAQLCLVPMTHQRRIQRRGHLADQGRRGTHVASAARAPGGPIGGWIGFGARVHVVS